MSSGRRWTVSTPRASWRMRLSGVGEQRQTHVTLPGPLRAAARPGGTSSEDKEESFRRTTRNEGHCCHSPTHLGVLPLGAGAGKPVTGDRPRTGQPPQTQGGRSAEAPGAASPRLGCGRASRLAATGPSPPRSGAPSSSAATWSPLTATARPPPRPAGSPASPWPLTPAGRRPGLRASHAVPHVS